MSIEQLVLIGLIFIWTGFVRTGIGFGGAALSLPLLLLVHNDPLFFLPIIGTHLLFFSTLTLSSRLHNIHWPFIKRAISTMMVPKIIGIMGLLTLPTQWLTTIVFVITFIYGLMWLFNYTIKSNSRTFDTALLLLGGYVSGTSLIGAPLIVTVAMRHVEKIKLRETLFVLWMILVIFKMAALLVTGIDMQWKFSIWLLPLAGIGHYFGLKAHAHLMSANSTLFHRVIGGILALISVIGLLTAYFWS